MAAARRRGAVVYGPYPPVPGPAAAATLDGVRRLLAGGADVTVISPVPSAAHEFADLSRPAGAWRFARRAAGADVLVVHLDADLLASPAHRGQLPARLALAAALRSARQSTVHLPAGADPVPAGWSKVVLSAADEVVVGAAPDGADAAPAPAAEETSEVVEDRPAWDLPADATREDIEAEVRRRAARRRAERRPTVRSGATAVGRDAALRSLRALPLLGPAPPTSARPLASLAKRVVRRLDTWQINPIIEHVNLLHRALVESAERQLDLPGAPGGEVPGGPDADR
ncbi:MAG TPA: hypothetical protein VFE55_13150 [Acidimicrobiia bacterium]|nr:hypothetical protein [Acidimicrobiia bacterium]